MQEALKRKTFFDATLESGNRKRRKLDGDGSSGLVFVQ